MRDILLKILAAIEDLAPVGSVAADPDSRSASQEETVVEEPKEEPKEAPTEEAPAEEAPVEEAPPTEEKKSTRRTSK